MANLTENGGEWQGSIAGDRDEEGIVQANLYVDDGLGAVDGITFQGEAEGIAYDTLLQKEGLPKEFHSLTVTFLAEDQMVERMVCRYGQSLTAADMPKIPEKSGFFQYWEETELSDIRKNYKIHAVYVPWTTTIADSKDPMPQMLAEGAFHPKAWLHVEEQSAGTDFSVPEGYRAAAVYHYEIQDEENQSLPETVKLHLLARGADGIGIIRTERQKKPK